jgi:three-Cys-motif partner protein
VQAYGGPWTLIKLAVLEEYLSFYIKVMNRDVFKLCYIDAFAGSGNVNIKGIGKISGSAVMALDHPFDRFIFIEKDELYADKLREIINIRGNIDAKVELGDCNELLKNLNSFPWYQEYWRGVIFLDPYAMNLNWASLKVIAKTKAFDVWYLFPLSALNRVLRRDGQIHSKTRETITKLLGTPDWENEIYYESPQQTLFGEKEIERIPINNIKNYIIHRLCDIFPGVADNALVLRNPINNSPLFLLCFAISNPNERAIEVSLRGANYILRHTT